MKRTVTRSSPKPDQPFQLIFGADFHLRDDIPECRERGEYLEAQERKLKFIHDLTLDNGATLLIAGDVFDQWRPSPWLISLAIRYLPLGTIVVPGQHDLPQHNLQEIAKTGLQTLQEAGTVVILSGGLRRALGDCSPSGGAVYGYAYGETAQNPPKADKGVKILLWHRLTTAGIEQPWPNAGAELAGPLTKKFKGFDVIVLGDNHQEFYNDSSFGYPALINPGSMMRMTSDQADFEPAVFGWRSAVQNVTRIPLPIKAGVVKATTHNAKAKGSRDERMAAYVKKASAQFETRLSFIKNLEQHFKANQERREVEALAWKAVG